jgi:hypothetical protein
MPPIIDLKMQGWTYVEDASRSPLFNGSFEGAVGPAGWSAFNAAISREAGTRTGGSGSYVGRNAYNGAAAIGLMYQSVCVVGVPYRSAGWMRTDPGGIAIHRLASGGGVTYWAGSASAAWESYDVNFTAAAVNFCVQCDNLAAGRYVEADDLILNPYIARTNNSGSLGGRLDLGDGLTAASSPSQLGRLQCVNGGMGFNGSQYLQWLSPITSGTFTYCALVQRTEPAAAAHYILDARAGGGTGYVLDNGGGVIATSSGTVAVNDAYGASGALTLPYGQFAFIAAVGITIASPSSLVLMARNDRTIGWLGNVFGQVLYPGTLTPTQLRDVKERLMARVRS